MINIISHYRLRAMYGLSVGKTINQVYPYALFDYQRITIKLALSGISHNSLFTCLDSRQGVRFLSLYALRLAEYLLS